MQPLCEKSRQGFENLKPRIRTSAHKGLVFERFFDGYSHDFSIDKTADTRALNDMTGKTGDAEQIGAAVERRNKLVQHLQGESGVFSTDWHFVTGMGNAHPVENGFTWHPVLGTPYLPGSGVKGLLRAWVEQWEEQNSGVIGEWFGSGADGNGDPGKAGDLIFLDAIPVSQPVVAVDVMTPHMGKWYEQGRDSTKAEALPGDWHNPVPVHFLVTREAHLLFSILPRNERGRALVSEAFNKLENALAWLGAGAKTAAGYGHFTRDDSQTQKLVSRAEDAVEKEKRERELATMSEEERAIDSARIALKTDQEGHQAEKGKGTSSRLWEDLRQLVQAATAWSPAEQEQVRELFNQYCTYLGIKKNKSNAAKKLWQLLS